MEENNEVEKKENNSTDKVSTKNKILRKELIAIVLVVIVAFLVILFVYKLLLIRGENNEKISEYLTNKYNDEFSIRYIKARTGLKYTEGSCDGSRYSYCTGIDMETKEYVYGFVSKTKPLKEHYVVYSVNLKDNTTSFYETENTDGEFCGKPDPAKRYYGEDLERERQKQEIVYDLKNYFDEEYTYDLESDSKTIIVEINKNPKDTVSNHYSELQEIYDHVRLLLKDKDILVYIKYVDGGVTMSESGYTTKYTTEDYKRKY